MNGYTPFGGIIETASVSQTSPGIGDSAVRRDSYCFKPGYKHQSAAIMPLEALPQEIADLFTRAFIIGKSNPWQRPDAVEWHGALTRYEEMMVTCTANQLHQFYSKNTYCPLCEADRLYKEVIGSFESSRGSLTQTVYKSAPQAVTAIATVPQVNKNVSSKTQQQLQTFVPPPSQPRRKKSVLAIAAAAFGIVVIFLLIGSLAHIVNFDTLQE